MSKDVLSGLGLTAKKANIGLKPGNYQGTVLSIEKTVSNNGNETPQLKVVFKTEKGNVARWFNLVGYKTDNDGNYVRDKKGMPIVDDEKTEKAIAIVQEFAWKAGIADGEAITAKALTDAKVFFKVELNEQGKTRVTRFYTEDQFAHATAEAELMFD